MVHRRDVLKMLPLVSLSGCSQLNDVIGSEQQQEYLPKSTITSQTRRCSEFTNRASVTFESDTEIEITGEIGARHRCDALTSSAFTSSSNDDAIVSVETASTNDECRECETSIEYDATVTFDTTIQRVTVRHVISGEYFESVTSAQRGQDEE